MTNNADIEWSYPGARWWRFDFHTHTPASSDTHWHRLIGRDGELTPEQWLQRYMDAGIDCVAITDHNSGAWIDKLKHAYERMQKSRESSFRKLHLFPGMEISVNGGFHLLAILDKDEDTASIDTLIGKINYNGTKGNSDGVTRRSPVEVIEAVLEAGGIPIPAHVDSCKGLLRVKAGDSSSPELDANTIRQVLNQPDILAMEVMDRSGSKPSVYTEIGLSWSEVLGSDCHNFRSGPQPGSRFTWVKMEEPSLEGLRLALLDGNGFSIRRSDDLEPFDPFELPEHFIESIEIANAQYMGRDRPAKLEFSPWLNGLVGGRGTGKSTVIHALRLVSRREEELANLEKGSEPHVTFERFNQVPSGRMGKGGLKESSEIQWTAVRDRDRYRIHWKQDGSGTAVEEAVGSDNWQPARVQTVAPKRFPVRMFSQGQIAALAGEDQRALLQVIDEAAGVASLQRNLEESCGAFFAKKARIRELEGKLDRRNDLVVEQRDVERKLKRFEEAGHTEILTAYRHRKRQRTVVDRQFDTAEAAANRIKQTAAALQPEDLPDGLFNDIHEEDRQVAVTMADLAASVRTAAQDLEHISERLREFIETQREKLNKIAWRTAVEYAANEYESLIETLREEGVTDPSEYGRLVQERQRIDGELASLDSVQEDRDRLIEQSQSLLEDVTKARRAVSHGRDRFLQETLAHNEFVRIRSLHYGADHRTIERSLRETLEVLDHFEGDILVMDEGGLPAKGCIATLLNELPRDSVQRSREMENRISLIKRRIHAAGTDHGDFGGHFNNHLKVKYAKSPEVFDRMQTWFPEDGLLVEYSRRGDGADFRPIAQASAGQRSAAMLAFLLAHGEEPLVLDQPEDDLDNHLIYDLVVRQIRENKLRRQIIVVTHNPNIIVNGDAEMLHALDFKAGQCVVAQSGSLQKKDMREEVCRVMEGGREAFQRRYRRLGPEPTHV